MGGWVGGLFEVLVGTGSFSRPRWWVGWGEEAVGGWVGGWVGMNELVLCCKLWVGGWVGEGGGLISQCGEGKTGELVKGGWVGG